MMQTPGKAFFHLWEEQVYRYDIQHMSPCWYVRKKKRAIDCGERLQLTPTVDRQDQLDLAALDVLVGKHCASNAA